MKYLRVLFLPILLVGLMGLLTACGGDSPTATVALALPTATTAAMAADTPTTAMAADTPTTAAMAVDTPTASTGSGTGTGVSDPTLQAALDAMKAVKSYHYKMTTETSAATGAQTIEGDMILPDKMSMTINMSAGGQTIETKMIRIGGTTWTNVGGKWTQMQLPVAINPSDLTNMGNISDVQNLGDDTVDGIATTHLRYKSTMADPTGAGATLNSTAEVWIDKATHYTVQIVSSSDIATTGTTKVTMKMSKFNDPSIKIEAPQ